MSAVRGAYRASAAAAVIAVIAVIAVASAAVAGCAGAPAESPTPESPTAEKPRMTLTATLDSPTDITLRWNGRDPGAAGRTVEFATEPGGPYTILQFLPPGRATFTHPDLMPKTPFYYRLRPFYGPTSAAVNVTLPAGDLSEQDQRNDHEWAEPRTLSGDSGPSHSVRTTAAAPTGLKATVMHANGIRLTWQDHARGEEGYLIELRPYGDPDFRVAAVAGPGIESIGLITLPDEKKSTVRVRAYYYGEQSNVVHRTTGPEV
ncbi:fibronectin type III domain-containing protein [Streptomyces sp. NPDC005407]|uniref:fibronectin type III domain-containing protein n=1 Tax=Streptomyces sp. NPDC005407 TaxID=3155340 RepID=UPI0033B651C2